MRINLADPEDEENGGSGFPTNKDPEMLCDVFKAAEQSRIQELCNYRREAQCRLRECVMGVN